MSDTTASDENGDGPSPDPRPAAPPATGRRRARALTVLVVAAIAVLLLAEGAARVLAPYLPEPKRYGDDTTAVKVLQLQQPGRCVDVVVAGDSMARDAFAPAAFSSADPSHRPAYNASLDAASPELLRRWLGDEVIPRLHPATVVLAVASLDLNANGNATRGALDAYDHAEATQPGVAGRLESWAGGRSDLFRYRQSLRDPAAVADAITRRREGRPQDRLSASGIPGLIGADGEGLSRTALHYRHDAGTKAFTRDQLLAHWELDEAQVQALRALVEDLRAGGTDVVLTVLPVTGDYVALHPKGSEDFDTFLAAVRGVATQTGVPLVDLHDALADDSRFADTHHLNGDGQAWFSGELPGLLATAGVPGVRTCP